MNGQKVFAWRPWGFKVFKIRGGLPLGLVGGRGRGSVLQGNWVRAFREQRVGVGLTRGRDLARG